MEKKIKILHGLTIITIIAFCAMQSYWLYTRYQYTLQAYEDELYESVINATHQEFEIRRAIPNQDIKIISNWRITANSDYRQQKALSWLFNIYVVDLSKYAASDSLNFPRIADIYEKQHPTGIKKYRFMVNGHNNERDVYEALDRFSIDESTPFSTGRLDSILKKGNISVKNITTEKVDSMVWKPSRSEKASLFGREMTIVYPYDVFQGEKVRITIRVGTSPVILRMSGTLSITLVLSLLLISCLVSQIVTIRKQRKLEELRKDFIHTMIHELKRPIATLKMCVSFMRNEKLMHDKESKDAVITDSYNELDNLSSYFAKLRDLSSNEIEDIPLNLSTFCLMNLLKQCQSKLNVPYGKEASVSMICDKEIKVTADKMHLTNIVSNLLENAIKYSGKKVSIAIKVEVQKNVLVMSIKDDGFGISKSESKYIFDKFFRSKAVTDKDIPGMGLGLAYVKLLVTAHKGTINLESKEGLGSVFTIKLPQ